MATPIRFITSPQEMPPATCPPNIMPEFFEKINLSLILLASGNVGGCLSIASAVPVTISKPSFMAVFSVSPADPNTFPSI